MFCESYGVCDFVVLSVIIIRHGVRLFFTDFHSIVIR